MDQKTLMALLWLLCLPAVLTSSASDVDCLLQKRAQQGLNDPDEKLEKEEPISGNLVLLKVIFHF